MITIVNADNATQYTNLYRKAEQALINAGVQGVTPFSINTLEKYFYFLPDLKNLTGPGEDKYSQTLGRRYMMLPLDEAHFDINANERRITIPESFRKNGIAVQGDQASEVIYFKIHRYFDFMDLNNTDIYIQWSRGENDNGLSNEWVRDIESDPDYLIFGWALDDQITEKSGQIKFSVRFIDWKRDADGNLLEKKEENIAYSLSTIEAVANIQSSLDLNITPTNIAEVEQMIDSRIRRSMVVGAPSAKLPKFTLTLLDWVEDVEDEAYNDSTGVDLNNKGEYTFRIQAYGEDGGHITYYWYNIDNSKSNALSGIDSEDYYERIEASEENPYQPEANQIYYIQDENGKFQPDGNIVAGGTDKIIDSDHFKRYGQLIAKKAGTYIGVAQNRIGTYDSGAAVMPNLFATNIDTKYGPIYIPGASPVVITNDIEENRVEQETGNWIGYILSNSEIKLNPTVTKGNEKDTVTYQWYRQWDTEELELLEGETNKDCDIKENGLQGNYILKATSHRNNDDGVEVTSKKFVVTYPALQPIVSYDKDAINVNSTVTAIVDFSDNYQKGNELTYQWYKITGVEGTKTPVGNATKSATFKPTEDGVYKCEVTNTYNTDIKTAISDLYVQVYGV